MATARPCVDLTRSVSVWPFPLKLRRAVWQWLLQPVFMLLPRPANGPRIFLLRLMGARIDPGCRVSPKVDVLMPWNLSLSSHVALGRAVNVYNYAPIHIGSMTLISQNAFLCTGTHDYTHPHMPLVWQPITIGAECWIAADVFIGPGVTIGNGTVVGARSVVVKDLPAWMVCAGNPCKARKPRKLSEPRPSL